MLCLFPVLDQAPGLKSLRKRLSGAAHRCLHYCRRSSCRLTYCAAALGCQPFWLTRLGVLLLLLLLLPLGLDQAPGLKSCALRRGCIGTSLLVGGLSVGAFASSPASAWPCQLRAWL